MKSSTRDEAEGKLHQVKGKIKEVAGKLSDNPELEAEGTDEKIAAKFRKKSVRSRRFWGSRAVYHAPREANNGRDQASCRRPERNKRLKREGERTNARPSRRRGEGSEARGQRKNPKLTQIYNKVNGGNYHGYYNAHHHHCRVDPIVRRGRRLLVE